MSDKVNSFTETVNSLVNQVNISLSSLVALNKSTTTQDDTVQMSIEQTDPITGDASTVTYSIPSYNYTINKVNSVSQSVDTFVKGEGVVLTNDGTYREVKTIPVPISPERITEVSAPSKFSVKSNWFFESMMFPQLTVKFDLKDKIDDRSDRVRVKRLIFDNHNDDETQWFLDNFSGSEYTYYDAVQFLNENNKKYWEDEENQMLPLNVEPYTGYFIVNEKRTIDSKEWFILDTLNYGETSDEPVVKNYQLAIGNLLRFNNAIFKVDDINIPEKRVLLVLMSGLEYPSYGSKFEIYTEPFSEKIADIPIGYNECNIIFIKGINEDYNLLADDWSNSISFWTNNLILEDNTLTLSQYYNEYVADFGKQLEGQAKEKFIPAFLGIKPDAPIFNADQFQVSQINTQLNAALDTDEVKNTQTQIESTKTIINSLKSTISQQKAQLVELTDPGERNNLSDQIDSNISVLSKRTVEYQSLVRSLSTLAYENSAVSSSPKYRVRGFFDIPEGKSGTEDEKNQEIIQFEVSYRYLRLDNTGNPLNSYSYNDPSSGQTLTGVYSEWVILPSSIKEKVLDSSTGTFIWTQPSIADGEISNINQVDIPIQKGEKVEFKIRSISEAGWPLNAMKSDWSDSVVIEFPSNLKGSDQVSNILSDAVAEESTIKLDETLSSTGIYTHIDDSIPNPNAGDGTYFKHQAKYLAYDLETKDDAGLVTTVRTTDLQSFLADSPRYTYLTILDPNTGQQHTSTVAQIIQELVNSSATSTPFNFNAI